MDGFGFQFERFSRGRKVEIVLTSLRLFIVLICAHEPIQYTIPTATEESDTVQCYSCVCVCFNGPTNDAQPVHNGSNGNHNSIGLQYTTVRRHGPQLSET